MLANQTGLLFQFQIVCLMDVIHSQSMTLMAMEFVVHMVMVLIPFQMNLVSIMPLVVLSQLLNQHPFA